MDGEGGGGGEEKGELFATSTHFIFTSQILGEEESIIKFPENFCLEKEMERKWKEGERKREGRKEERKKEESEFSSRIF